jgi:hypothetical protein
VDAGELRDRAERLRTQMVEVGDRFAEAAGPALARWLEGAVERLVVAQADRINELKPEAVGTLRRAVAAATARAVEEATRSLREPTIWLEPTVTVDRFPDREMGVPNHRAWIALLRAVRSLDPVLTEFGLQANPVPAFGGARFGLEPQRLSDIDRNGSLDRLWDRYLDLHGRYREALERIPEEEDRREREEALRRWRNSR